MLTPVQIKCRGRVEPEKREARRAKGEKSVRMDEAWEDGRGWRVEEEEMTELPFETSSLYISPKDAFFPPTNPTSSLFTSSNHRMKEDFLS